MKQHRQTNAVYNQGPAIMAHDQVVEEEQQKPYQRSEADTNKDVKKSAKR
jgi:hypothetical protein